MYSNLLLCANGGDVGSRLHLFLEKRAALYGANLCRLNPKGLLSKWVNKENHLENLLKVINVAWETK